MMSSPITPHHLGGHMGVTHTDEGALRELMGISPTSRAFIDIGCGPGRQVQLASLAGLHAYGIDGDPALRGSDSWVALPQSFLCMDLTDPDSAALSDFLPNTNTAIGWSVEFLEHLEEQYLPNLIDVFCRCSIVAVTAAPPGHLGHHHVNLQSEDYWVSKFEDLFGLTHDPALTQRVRNASTMGRAFMRCQGLVFVQS